MRKKTTEERKKIIKKVRKERKERNGKKESR